MHTKPTSVQDKARHAFGAFLTVLGASAVLAATNPVVKQVRADLARQAALLDLGDVRESARVRLNGRALGTLIALPFRLPVGAHLKAGENTLEIEVTNLSANRIRDLERRKVDWKIMREINFVNINYKPFDASNWPLTDCGLLGPVTLTPVVAE